METTKLIKFDSRKELLCLGAGILIGYINKQETHSINHRNIFLGALKTYKKNCQKKQKIIVKIK